MGHFGAGTEAYARHVGRYGGALSAAHADRAGLVVGERALDVGCGPGALLAELARRLGASQVAGVDPTEPFLAAARAAVPNADVHVGSAERLPFDADAFDVVLSQLVVNFMDDAESGVAEMRRGGRRAGAPCRWGYPGGVASVRGVWGA